MAGIVNLQLIDYEIEDVIDYIIYPQPHSWLIVKPDEKNNLIWIWINSSIYYVVCLMSYGKKSLMVPFYRLKSHSDGPFTN